MSKIIFISMLPICLLLFSCSIENPASVLSEKKEPVTEAKYVNILNSSIALSIVKDDFGYYKYIVHQVNSNNTLTKKFEGYVLINCNTMTVTDCEINRGGYVVITTRDNDIIKDNNYYITVGKFNADFYIIWAYTQKSFGAGRVSVSMNDNNQIVALRQNQDRTLLTTQAGLLNRDFTIGWGLPLPLGSPISGNDWRDNNPYIAINNTGDIVAFTSASEGSLDGNWNWPLYLSKGSFVDNSVSLLRKISWSVVRSNVGNYGGCLQSLDMNESGQYVLITFNNVSGNCWAYRTGNIYNTNPAPIKCAQYSIACFAAEMASPAFDQILFYGPGITFGKLQSDYSISLTNTITQSPDVKKLAF